MRIPLLRFSRTAFAIGAMMTVALSLISTRSEARSLCPRGGELTVRLPDPVSGRQYEIYVSLPANYAKSSGRSYPLVIIADGGRAFPKLKCDAHALESSKAIGQSIIVGLSYALGDDLQDSRRRDYTPSALSGGENSMAAPPPISAIFVMSSSAMSRTITVWPPRTAFSGGTHMAVFLVHTSC